MPFPPRPITEQDRLRRIAQTGLLASATPGFVRDLLQRLSAEFHVKICLMTVVGEHLQHILASVGSDLVVTPRDHAFCAYTILSDDVMVIADAQADERFATNPYVTGKPFIRFYAGAPLVAVDGHRLGSLCLLDDAPRAFSRAEVRRLAEAAASIAERLGLLHRSDALSHFTCEDLARMIHMQIGSTETPFSLQLVNALFARLGIAAG